MMLNARLIQETHADSAVATAVVAEPVGPPLDPPDGAPVAADEATTLGLVELLLKDPVRVDRLGQDETRQGLFIPRFLAIALTSYLLFTVAMVVILSISA